MKYRIFDKKRNTYLDSNLYYVNQNGVFYKVTNPLPTRLKEQQERYEVRIVLTAKNEGAKNGN